jgi:hypothetical protein
MLNQFHPLTILRNDSVTKIHNNIFLFAFHSIKCLSLLTCVQPLCVFSLANCLYVDYTALNVDGRT